MSGFRLSASGWDQAGCAVEATSVRTSAYTLTSGATTLCIVAFDTIVSKTAMHKVVAPLVNIYADVRTLVASTAQPI